MNEKTVNRETYDEHFEAHLRAGCEKFKKEHPEQKFDDVVFDDICEVVSLQMKQQGMYGPMDLASLLSTQLIIQKVQEQYCEE